MPLASGSRFGPYEILSPLGSGGMGEVYRARDAKLKREVALKVLPEPVRLDPDRLARFTREAQLLASLNHPNIGAIYGLEESNGVQALVLELVEGPTLADRLAQGAIPLEEALPIAKQIAEALETAHEQGVIHRDLKPANIKLRPDGTVKVLDFGLAKALEPMSGLSANVTASPTMTSPAMTGMGVILGTAAYMAPEQARGKTVDKRADIWAFGCALYEMITARRAFGGEEISDTLAAILLKEPDWTALPANTPQQIQRLLRRCLEKDPKRRLHDIADARIEIEDAIAAPATDAHVAAPRAASRVTWRSRLPFAVAGALGLALLVLGALFARATRPVEQPLIRLDADLGAGVSLGSAAGPDLIMSPDGARLVYVSQNRLFTRRLDQPKAVELVGTEGAYAPFFSPDGRWLGFFTPGKLNRVSVDGGATITLSAWSTGGGGSWGEDNTIVAGFAASGSVLMRIPATGGNPEPVTELDRQQGENTHRWPQLLPGGKAVLFTTHTATSGFDGANIDVMSFADHRRKTLQRGATYGRYVAGGSDGTGYLVYINRGTLFAVPFDAARLEVRGTPIPILEDVAYSAANGSAQFDVSQNGVLVYRGGGEMGYGLYTLQWLDAEGKIQPLVAKPGVYGRPKFSPDGNRLALEVTDGSNTDVWVQDLRRGTMSRLTFGGGANLGPIWSPDGRYIVFQTPEGLSWTPSDAGKPQPLTRSKNNEWAFSFAPDGKRLGFMEVAGIGYDLWTVRLDADGAGLRVVGKPEPFLQSPFDERYPSFSHDGHWLAYASNESGIFQVYVRAFPDKGAKWQVSRDGGAYPLWSRNGPDLFFETLDNRIMAATYTIKGDVFEPGPVRVWSEKRLANLVNVARNYDLAPGGKRIVALLPAETREAQAAESHVTFPLNFSDELRRRVPAAGK